MASSSRVTHFVLWHLAIAFLCAAWRIAYAESDEGVARLVAAYPDFLAASPKPNVILWKDGTEWPFDDGVRRDSYEVKLANPCMEDQLSIPYPCAWPFAIPALNEDPGRIRYEPFFKRMYGSDEKEVRANLVNVDWPPARNGKKMLFTRVNGAAEALARVAREIAGLPAETRRYAAKPVGTFSWRTIAGTERLSMHSFGAAIDLEFPNGCHQYWKWEKEGGGEQEKTPHPLPVTCTYPKQIVDDERLAAIVHIFEKHGFIWGGKWYHYDTMHFEYRPEMLTRP